MRRVSRLLIPVLLVAALTPPAAALGVRAGREPGATSRPPTGAAGESAPAGAPAGMLERIVGWLTGLLDGDHGATSTCTTGTPETCEDGPTMDPNG